MNYPKWSKDKRVSEIQYEELLNLDEDIITKSGENTTESSDNSSLTEKASEDIRAQILSDSLKFADQITSVNNRQNPVQNETQPEVIPSVNNNTAPTGRFIQKSR